LRAQTITTKRTRVALHLLLAALLVTAAVPLERCFAAPPAKVLSFLVLGDWGRGGADLQREVAGQMAKAAAAYGAQFVISTGDNFYEAGVSSVNSPQWQKSFENIYTQPELQVPWYPTVGNHDHRGNVQAQVDYSSKSKRWRMPALYYNLTQPLPGGGLAEFFFLDTQLLLNGSGKQANAQWRWLEDGLARSKADWRVVVGHHPVYSGGSEHGDTPELVHRLKPLLDRYHVQLYLNGHDHDLQHIVVDGVNYVTSGAGSATRTTKSGPHTRFSLGSTSGFVWMGITRDSLTARFIDWRGRERYAFAQAR